MDRRFAAGIFGGMVGVLGTAIIFALCWPSPVQAVAKPAAMPTQLDLGGIVFKVDVVQRPGNSDEYTGYTRCDTHRIELNVKETDLREVLAHEILHGYVCQNADRSFGVGNMYYNSITEGGHEGIERIAQIFTDALERNPGLGDYLAGGKN